MVSRTAYTQLGYSPTLLVLVTLAMLVAFVAPLVGVAGVAGPVAATMSAAALLVTASVYLPMMRFYRQSPAWVFALPLAAGLYMLMTWSSALAYWRGVRATWKDRRYEVSK